MKRTISHSQSHIFHYTQSLIHVRKAVTWKCYKLHIIALCTLNPSSDIKSFYCNNSTCCNIIWTPEILIFSECCAFTPFTWKSLLRKYTVRQILPLLVLEAILNTFTSQKFRCQSPYYSVRFVLCWFASILLLCLYLYSSSSCSNIKNARL